MANKEKYLKMLRDVYLNGTNNHPEHNSNPDYWYILLSDLKNKNFDGKVALDFGCGKGRNITNMFSVCNFSRVDGVDISPDNISYCRSHHLNNSLFYLNDGLSLKEISDDEYDFVMSTIVLQHICVYEIRFNILKEIFRVMKNGGLFSFQMGYGNMNYIKDAQISDYYDNNFLATNSNGTFDVRVTNPSQIITDLEKIGFKNIKYQIKPSWADGGHEEWIYVKCEK